LKDNRVFRELTDKEDVINSIRQKIMESAIEVGREKLTESWMRAQMKKQHSHQTSVEVVQRVTQLINSQQEANEDALQLNKFN
jgi:hypothetical protein